MPELPEVETTVKGLEVIRKEKINKIQIHTKKLRLKIPNNLKYILLNSNTFSFLKKIIKWSCFALI